MLAQLPTDETFIISIWTEVLVYGFYSSLFCASLYVVVRRRNYRTTPSKVMFITMIIMFILATIHIATNMYRLLRGYVWLRNAPGGPAAYYGDLARWDHVFKDSIYATQSIIGDGLAIYRCWLVWDNNYYVIALPFALLICSSFSGYITCWLFTQVSSTTVFDPRLQKWVTVFYGIAVAQNLMTTGLIAFRIWQRERAATSILKTTGSGRHSLFPVIRVLVESAALYVAAELVLLVLYELNLNAQFILLETITPTAGIAFTSITVRLSLRTSRSTNATTAVTTTGAPNFQLNPLSVRVTRNVQKERDLDSEEVMGSEDGRSFGDK